MVFNTMDVAHRFPPTIPITPNFFRPFYLYLFHLLYRYCQLRVDSSLPIQSPILRANIPAKNSKHQRDLKTLKISIQIQILYAKV